MKKKILLFLTIVFVITISGLLYAYYEARNIKLKEIDFSSNDLPASFVGKKIIFISDTHTDKYFTGEDVKRLVERINKRKPDIIVLGGDHTMVRTPYSTDFFNEIRNLKSTYGVYTVLGNHDHWSDAEFIQKGLIDCGFNICDNKSYWIKEGNDSIKIGGVGDYWEDRQLLDETINDVKPSDFCILLSHNPDYMEKLHSDCIDLMLSGHTHAGQITLFGLWAPIMPSTFHPEYPQTGQKYRYGWVAKEGIRLYVTSGVGMGGFPFRFFANPEIVEITLLK